MFYLFGRFLSRIIFQTVQWPICRDAATVLKNNDAKMENAICRRIDPVLLSSDLGTGTPDGASLNHDFYDLDR